MDDKMSRAIPEEEVVEQEVEKNQEHKKRKRKSPEEKLAELIKKDEEAKRAAEERAKSIKELQDKIKYSKIDSILAIVDKQGLTEVEFVAFLEANLQRLISECVHNKLNQ